MRRSSVCAIAVLFMLSTSPNVFAQKSALDGFQFDGVSSDAELKVERLTRRQWLEIYPVQAKEYWDAWDCKGKPCDSKRKANIRKKAALIKRTVKDPPMVGSAVTKSQG